MQWNAVSMLSSARASDTRRAQELAGWTLRTRFYRSVHRVLMCLGQTHRNDWETDLIESADGALSITN